jgi:hypothetical protein
LLSVVVLFAFLVALVWLLGLPLVVTLAVSMYGVFVLASFTGGLIYERRHELGHDAWQSPERTAAKQQAEVDRARDLETDRIYAHYRMKAYADAWDDVQRVLAEYKHDHGVYRALYARIARWPQDPRLANRLAGEFVSRLLATRAQGEALALVRERLRIDPTFRPRTGAELVTLVHVARASTDRATARALVADFDRYFAGDAAAPVVAQLARELER